MNVYPKQRVIHALRFEKGNDELFLVVVCVSVSFSIYTLSV